jgi:hypothetical protein
MSTCLFYYILNYLTCCFQNVNRTILEVISVFITWQALLTWETGSTANHVLQPWQIPGLGVTHTYSPAWPLCSVESEGNLSTVRTAGTWSQWTGSMVSGVLLCSGCTKDYGDFQHLVKTFNDFLESKVYFLIYFNLGKCLSSNGDFAPIIIPNTVIRFVLRVGEWIITLWLQWNNSQCRSSLRQQVTRRLMPIGRSADTLSLIHRHGWADAAFLRCLSISKMPPIE